MNTLINISHQVLEYEVSYESFTEALKKLLGRISGEDFKLVIKDPQQAKTHLSTLGGFQNLILFGTQEHGSLLSLEGAPRKAAQYHIGNPLTALEMTKLDIRAALYAPLRVLVYERVINMVTVEYDLPSSLFGQFRDRRILQTALGLDAKLLSLLNQASISAGESPD